MDDFFRKLDEQEYFEKFVTDFFASVPDEMATILECCPDIDKERVAYAHGEYVQNVQKFSVILHSADPDHYKRAGSLLHALYQSKVIDSVGFVAPLDDIESGLGPVHIHNGDVADDELDFARFYQEYANEMLAFILAFRCCSAYETTRKEYDFDYLRTVCVYMKKNANLSVESFFMLFKSLFY